jgi:hypothetical protein
MNVNKVLSRDYENNSNWTLGENKPNTKPNKANFQKAAMDVNNVLTRDYENKSNWALYENKPNINPKQSQTNPIPPPLLEQQINISKSSFYTYTSPGLYMRVVDFCQMEYNNYPSFKAMEEIVRLYKKYRDNIGKIGAVVIFSLSLLRHSNKTKFVIPSAPVLSSIEGAEESIQIIPRSGSSF